MMPNLVEPVFLMRYSDADPVSDYRCVVNGSASQVIFERTSFRDGTGGPTRLYVLDLVRCTGSTAGPGSLTRRSMPGGRGEGPVLAATMTFGFRHRHDLCVDISA